MADLSTPKLALNIHRLSHNMAALLTKSKTAEDESRDGEHEPNVSLRSSSIFKTRRLNAQADNASNETSHSEPTPCHSYRSKERTDANEAEEIDLKKTRTKSSPHSSVSPTSSSGDGIAWGADSSYVEDPTKAFPQRETPLQRQQRKSSKVSSSQSTAPNRAFQSPHSTTLVDLLRYEREKRERFAEVESADELREYLAQLRRASQSSQSLPGSRPRRSATAPHGAHGTRVSATYTTSTERQSSLV